ncbi:potassium channel family protein [Pseudomonas sp. BJa5]|uniref:potassium channel family protein n=1 Tax=Pseudomonas sp. BJa5 TaxID=2936270 RepID=UPI002559AED8|nr:potassium channel family protein [Pseudomonas sp. BGr12]MDL2420933.1 potassium channel family protein [Pseudomonas sp. BGr12]
MLINFLVGLPVIVLCVILQALFLALCAQRYVVLRRKTSARPSWRDDVRLLSMVMVVMLIGNYVQMALWAVLFLLLGEFEDFTTALYFSGVTFATLGYGDVVLSDQWRLLSPLEAANGILMFGVSTAIMTAAVMDTIKLHASGRHEKR